MDAREFKKVFLMTFLVYAVTFSPTNVIQAAAKIVFQRRPTFQFMQQFQGSVPSGGPILLRDMNNDGLNDFFETGHTHGEVYLRYADDDGTFDHAFALGPKSSKKGFVSFDFGDFDKDGYEDVLLARGDRGLFLCLTQGKKKFSKDPTKQDCREIRRQSTPNESLSVFRVSVADLNRDGILDIATGRKNALVLWGQAIPQGDPKTKGQSLLLEDLNLGEVSVQEIRTVDLVPDSAQLKDIVVATRKGASLRVYYNLGSKQFEPPKRYGQSNYKVSAMEFGDFNNDGFPDLVLGDLEGNSRAHFNGGNENSIYDIGYPLLSEDDSPTYAISVVDLNADDYDDIVLGKKGKNLFFVGQDDHSFTEGFQISEHEENTKGLFIGPDTEGTGERDIFFSNAGSSSSPKSRGSASTTGLQRFLIRLR